MTTAASVAFGSRPSSGASSSMVASAAAAVTSEAFCERPPAARDDRRLRGAAARRHGAEQRAGEVARAGRDQFAVGVDRRVAGAANARPAAIVSVKLISAMPGRRRQRAAWMQRQVGQRDRRQSLRDQPTVETPSACEAEQPRRRDAQAHRDQRRRRVRPQALHADQHDQRRDARPRASAARSRERAGRRSAGRRKKPCLVMWMPSSLGSWSSTMTRPMPALKPVSTGVEMKLATKPSRMQPGEQQHPRRPARVSVAVAVISRAGSPSGTTMAEFGAGQDRQRGRRADAQHARRAEQRVDDHRDEGGVQAHRHGQAGHGRVGHRLGQHDRGRGQAGDDIEAPDVAGGSLRFGRHACSLRGRRSVIPRRMPHPG